MSLDRKRETDWQAVAAPAKECGLVLRALRSH